MAVFSFEGAASGAAVGASAGPYGAIAGFVIGGFIGGIAGNKAKKAAARRERQLLFLASPENFNNIARTLTPGFAALANATVGPAAASSAATQSARRELTTTGFGAALAANAAAAPGIAAFGAARQAAGGIQQGQISALGGTPTPGSAELGQSGNLPGNSTAQLTTLMARFKKGGNDITQPTLAPQLEPPRGDIPPVNTPPDLLIPPGGIPSVPKQFSRPRGPVSNPFARGV